ncbi:hypothetical protein D3C85_1658890 [compost metagenome]
MTAAMNGMIMIDRIRPAVKMPMPNGGPAKSPPMMGTLPSVAIRKGCTYCWNTGTKTNRPHMP